MDDEAKNDEENRPTDVQEETSEANVAEEAEPFTMDSEVDLLALPSPDGKFELLRVIGEGSSAVVYEAKNIETGRHYAIKIIQLSGHFENEIQMEYKILKRFEWDFQFLDFYGAYYYPSPPADQPQVWLVTELGTRGTALELVQSLRQQGKYLSEIHIAFIIKEVLTVVCKLHKEGIIHRDIRASNIVFTENGDVKLIDFGLCIVESLVEKEDFCVGSPAWMAPEAINMVDHAYDSRVDVWALGILALELAEGEAPLGSIPPERALFQIVRNPPPTVKNPYIWSDIFRDFVSECLTKNAEYRPCSLEILEHPFLTQLPKNDTFISTEIKILTERYLKKDDTKASCKPEVTLFGQVLRLDRHGNFQKLCVDDLATLDLISEATLLQNLQGHFERSQYYTYVGDTLLFINPYTKNDTFHEEYHGKYKEKARFDNPPHIYAVADNAYHDMLHHKRPQTVIFLGDRGSGKSVNADHLLRHVVYLGKRPNLAVNEKLLHVLPVLDAFGNARTPQNLDSTRYSRHLEATFNNSGHVTGVIIHAYLLETWRVTNPSKEQGTFHVFHYFYDGLREEGKLDKYGLNTESFRRHRYLANGYPQIEKYNGEKFRELQQALMLLAITPEEMDTIWECLAAIILLGDFNFIKVGRTIDIGNSDKLKKVADHLKIEQYKLRRILLNPSTSKNVSKPVATPAEAAATRDALAQLLYSRLFDWIINAINNQLSFSRIVFGDVHSLFVVDFPGFEYLTDNSMEQLLGNIIAEQSLYHFHRQNFDWELEECAAEGADIPPIQHEDNSPILELCLSRRPGQLLNTLAMASRDTESLQQMMEFVDSSICSTLFYTEDDGHFVVRHTIGNISYNARDFREKTQDRISREIIVTLASSGKKHIREMFTNPLTKTGNLCSEMIDTRAKKNEGKSLKKFNTLSRGLIHQDALANPSPVLLFRQALTEMLSLLTQGTPHFVICMKANCSMEASKLCADEIKAQLKTYSILELARLRQHGFSHRIDFSEFLTRYQYLAFDFDETVELTKENCSLLLLRLNLEGWKMGKTKVLLKYYHVEYLSRLYEEHVRKIVKTQALVRRFLAIVRQRKEARERKDAALAEEKILEEKCKEAEDTPENEEAESIGDDFDSTASMDETASENEEEQKSNEEEEKVLAEQQNAATIIQKCYKRWRFRTIFETLQRYRSARAMDLVYYCQQVHLYNQEIHCSLRKAKAHQIDQSKITPTFPQHFEALCKAVRPAVTKMRLPLRLSDIGFQDTTPMCESNASKGTLADEILEPSEDWDAPLRKALPLKVFCASSAPLVCQRSSSIAESESRRESVVQKADQADSSMKSSSASRRSVQISTPLEEVEQCPEIRQSPVQTESSGKVEQIPETIQPGLYGETADVDQNRRYSKDEPITFQPTDTEPTEIHHLNVRRRSSAASGRRPPSSACRRNSAALSQRRSSAVEIAEQFPVLQPGTPRGSISADKVDNVIDKARKASIASSCKSDDGTSLEQLGHFCRRKSSSGSRTLPAQHPPIPPPLPELGRLSRTVSASNLEESRQTPSSEFDRFRNKSVGTTSSDEDPPFNFRALLKKRQEDPSPKHVGDNEMRKSTSSTSLENGIHNGQTHNNAFLEELTSKTASIMDTNNKNNATQDQGRKNSNVKAVIMSKMDSMKRDRTLEKFEIMPGIMIQGYSDEL